MNINLKKFVDRKDISLSVLSKITGLSIEILEGMYYNGTFNGTAVGVQSLSDLLIVLDIKNVNDLVPEIK